MIKARDVRLEVKAIIRPQLKSAGFGRFNERTAWRYHADKIDVVNFGFLGPYDAPSNLTACSFVVNLGCYFPAIRDSSKRLVPEKNGRLLPVEYRCHFRNRLKRIMHQPGNSFENIWFMDEEGYLLESVVHDAGESIRRFAMPWFDRFSSMEEVLRTLREDHDGNADGTWGMGSLPSPNRCYMTAYVALALGKKQLALAQFHAGAEWYRQLMRQTNMESDREEPFGRIVAMLQEDIDALQESRSASNPDAT